MPNLLHRLKINEVSSCKVGAGHGVKVMLMKSEDAKPAPLADTAIGKIFHAAIANGVPIAEVGKAEVAVNKLADDIEKIEEGQQMSQLEKILSQCVEHLAGKVPVGKQDAFEAAVSAATKESPMPIDAALQKTIDDLTASNAALLRKVSLVEMTKEHREYFDVMPFEGVELTKAQDGFLAATVAKRDEVMKTFPPKKNPKPKTGDDVDDMDKMNKAIAENPMVKSLVAENASFKKAARVTEFSARAKALGLPETHGEVMMKAYDGDAEAQIAHDKMVKQLVTAAQNQTAASDLFKEFGSTGTGIAGTAYEKIQALGEELRKTDKNLSPQQARTKVLMDPANADLVKQHKNEESKRRGIAA